MKEMKISSKFLTGVLVLTFTFGGLLSACGSPAEQPTPAVAEATVELPATVVPTETQVPELDQIVLVTGNSEVNAENLSAVEAYLQDNAASSGWKFESRDSIQPSDVRPEWRAVVFLAAPENLSEFVSSFAEVQFIVFSSSDLDAAANLSVIHLHRDREAFVAGYIASLITADWRVGALLPSDSALGPNLTSAFQNGQHYFCGICNTVYAPYTDFPVVAALPEASNPADWEFGLTELEKFVIYGLYVAPEAVSPDLWNALAQRNLVLLGGETPPDPFRPLWAATIYQDVLTPFEAVFISAVSGSGGQAVDAALQITDINPDLFGEGKKALVDELITKLEQGEIYTLDVPLE